MNKIIFIFSFAFITNIIHAGDSLNKKPLNIIEFTYSGQKMIGAIYSVETYYGENQTYDTRFSNFLSINFQRNLTRKYKGVSQLYSGIGINYSNGTLKHTLISHSNGSSHFSDYTSFSQHEFNYNFGMVSITPHLSYNLIISRLIIFNKLGMSFAKYFSSNSYNYDEIISNSHPNTNPIYITPQNPQGYFWENSIISTTSKSDVFPVKTNLTFFYNISSGFRIWKLMPTIGCDINYYINFKGIQITKTNVGLAYLF